MTISWDKLYWSTTTNNCCLLTNSFSTHKLNVDGQQTSIIIFKKNLIGKRKQIIFFLTFMEKLTMTVLKRLLLKQYICFKLNKTQIYVYKIFKICLLILMITKFNVNVANLQKLTFFIRIKFTKRLK